MMPLTCGIQNMMQMHLPTKQKQTQPQGTDLCLQEGGGWEGWTGSLGLPNKNYYTQDR